MSEHLTLERLSAVLDEPGADSGAVAHLDTCAVCQRELEAMRRMQTALSNLSELDAPADAWGPIEAALPHVGTEADGGAAGADEPPVVGIRSRRRAFGLLGAWPLQAAAALVLFAGGLAVGVWLRQGSVADEVPAVTAGRDGGGEAAPEMTTDPSYSYEDARARLEALRLRTAPARVSAAEDPAAAAARLVQLDALVAASREALREAPEDPAVNDFLFEVIDERDALNAELSDVLHAATAEYR